jgi:hypothetical protein
MAADQYRRRAFEARQRGAQAFDSSIKAGWERVAHEWLALADQVELFHRRYGKLDSAEAIPHPSQIVQQQQQQQQVQPKKDDDKRSPTPHSASSLSAHSR